MRSCRVDRGVLRAEALHKHIAVLSNFGPRLRASFSSPARHRARPRELPCSMQVLKDDSAEASMTRSVLPAIIIHHIRMMNLINDFALPLYKEKGMTGHKPRSADRL